MRKVIDGERLSGHGDGSGEYPEILISDGIGAGTGSMICSIQSFHWADVVVKGGKTELWFENRLCLSIPNGIVEYTE
jgi:hypothetical protein